MNRYKFETRIAAGQRIPTKTSTCFRGLPTLASLRRPEGRRAKQGLATVEKKAWFLKPLSLAPKARAELAAPVAAVNATRRNEGFVRSSSAGNGGSCLTADLSIQLSGFCVGGLS